MANEINKNSTIDISALAALIAQNQAPGGNPGLDKLTALLTGQLQKEVDKDEEAAQVLIRQRANTKIEVGRRMAQTLANQAACTHRKDNGHPNLAGQRTGIDNGIVFLCLDCQKDWNEKTVPQNLATGELMSRIGGPILGSIN